jgi:hypothetical protein
VEDTWQPTDLFFAGKALLSLGKLGAGMTKALLVKAARRAGTLVLTGATKEVAVAATEDVEQQIAAATRDAETRARAFAQTTEKGSVLRPDGTLAQAGEGGTDKFGNIWYSTAGTADDVNLAKFHERVHSFLSPKLLLLRNFRANLAVGAYHRIHLLKYLEEALAETVAQVKVYGFKGLPTGIRFPVARGYVTLTRLAVEGTIGAVVVGGVKYGVNYVEEK